jgi:hypothetical protein
MGQEAGEKGSAAVDLQPTIPKSDRLLGDLELANPDRHALVLAIRQAIFAVAPDAAERVMYGGIMFSAPTQCCGVFAYAEHVSVEFGRGRELDDPRGVLEGQGKFRRHIKLRNAADIANKHLADYVRRAIELEPAA